jgi:hypothetical protein
VRRRLEYEKTDRSAERARTSINLLKIVGLTLLGLLNLLLLLVILLLIVLEWGSLL